MKIDEEKELTNFNIDDILGDKKDIRKVNLKSS